MKTVAIVQARAGSTRLPGKVLMDLAGETVLQRVVERVRRFTLVDEVIVATSELRADDTVVAECARIGVETFRGSESDVLERFVGAAQTTDADVCVRLTADCPLLESQKIELERRLADSIARPEAVTPWESIKARAMARARR